MVVTHGGSARAAIGSMLGLPSDHWESWEFYPIAHGACLVKLNSSQQVRRHP